MLEVKCHDCGALIPSECVEHDEEARTLFFHVKQDDAFRVFSLGVSVHAAPPAHPYTDGQALDLCQDCTIKSLQAEPFELPTPAAATAAGSK